MVAELPAIVPKMARKRLSLDDVEQIATLIVRFRLNEAEACLSLGIKPQTWYDWKCLHKHDAKYTDIISRIRGAQLQNVIAAIDKAGEERTIVTRKGDAVQVQGDWRAKAWIAERVLAPERLGDRLPQPQQPAQVQITIALEAAKAMYAKLAAAQVVDIQPEQNEITNGTNIK